MEKKKDEIILPTKKRKAISTSPDTMLLYSIPKAGKTTITANLDNWLTIELEPKGANAVDIMVLEALTPPKFEKILLALEKECPYDGIIIDTVTILDNWSETVGTYNYMNKPQGSKFNKPGENPTAKPYNHNHKAWQSVHDIGNGYGYKHSREQMMSWIKRIIAIAPKVIFLCHVKDKLIQNTAGDTIEAKDLFVTGKLRTIIPAYLDAVAHFRRDGNSGILNFTNDENKLSSGSRYSHLQGEIEISKSDKEGNITTFWDKVFIK